MLNKNHPILCIAFLALVLISTANALQNTQVSPSESYRFQINNFKFNDLHIGKKYNYFQTEQRIFMMNANMTIANFVEISIPDIIFAQQNCSKFTFNSAELYSISACKDLSDNTTYLVMVSFLSSRPFYAYSLKTDLKGDIKSMKLSGSVLVIQDQDEAPGVSSKLHIFRVNLGSSTSKPIEFVPLVNPQALGGLDSMIITAINEAITHQNSMISYGNILNSNIFAVDCSNQTSSSCKAFVGNSAQNSIDVYNIGKSFSISITNVAVSIPNTTFREWFFLFLAILGCLAILARCTSKKNGNAESEIARDQGVAAAESENNQNYRLVDNKDASLVSTPISRA